MAISNRNNGTGNRELVEGRIKALENAGVLFPEAFRAELIERLKDTEDEEDTSFFFLLQETWGESIFTPKYQTDQGYMYSPFTLYENTEDATHFIDFMQQMQRISRGKLEFTDVDYKYEEPTEEYSNGLGTVSFRHSGTLHKVEIDIADDWSWDNCEWPLLIHLNMAAEEQGLNERYAIASAGGGDPLVLIYFETPENIEKLNQASSLNFLWQRD